MFRTRSCAGEGSNPPCRRMSAAAVPSASRPADLQAGSRGQLDEPVALGGRGGDRLQAARGHDAPRQADAQQVAVGRLVQAQDARDNDRPAARRWRRGTRRRAMGTSSDLLGMTRSHKRLDAMAAVPDSWPQRVQTQWRDRPEFASGSCRHRDDGRSIARRHRGTRTRARQGPQVCCRNVRRRRKPVQSRRGRATVNLGMCSGSQTLRRRTKPTSNGTRDPEEVLDV